MKMQGLPIDSFLDTIAGAVRASRAAVVTAAPGAGKTTRVPPALLDDGPVLLLQPRRVAARNIASRIAHERGWSVGAEVGWHIRGERRFGPATRLLVATEGILTARLQHDPLLSDFHTIVIDEFHERSVHADLALALARQAWRARDDLRIVVMSATMESGPVAEFLGDCPVINVPGRTFSIDIQYEPGRTVADATVDLMDAVAGNILCFLPGVMEIRRTIAEINQRVPGRGIEIVALHGSLDPREQDAALRPAATRRVIVATNVAETSVTVPGVTAVVDAGLHKVARYDPDRGVDSLDLERITQDAADQRAGRAGRTAPGVARRLWHAHDRLRPHREPEVHRVDLCSAALAIIAWGGDPRRFEWFDPPRDEALDAAMTLLTRLQLVSGGSLTPLGEQAVRLPLHPRLARLLIAGGGTREMTRACALISERHFIAPRRAAVDRAAESRLSTTAATTSDLLSAIDDWQAVPPHVQRAAYDIERSLDSLRADRAASAVGRIGAPGGPIASLSPEAAFRWATLTGYPDRVAQRREAGSPRVRLSSGGGAAVARESGVVGGEFLVAIDLQAARDRAPATVARTDRGRPRPPSVDAPNDARVRVASIVEREWLKPTITEVVHEFDRTSGTVKAFEIDRYDTLVLAQRRVAADPMHAAPLLADAWLARGPGNADRVWLRRLRFAGRDVDLPGMIRQAAVGARNVDDLQLARILPADVMRALEREAPTAIVVPSGRAVALEYGDDGSVSAAVKLQELFGLGDTPRIGARREPVLFALLAPNGRPVQMTRDLRSFWDRTYQDVRKELRGRYPKHPWPDDPWNAIPTRRAKRKGE